MPGKHLMMYKLPFQIVIPSARRKGRHKFARGFPQPTVASAQATSLVTLQLFIIQVVMKVLDVHSGIAFCCLELSPHLIVIPLSFSFLIICTELELF